MPQYAKTLSLHKGVDNRIQFHLLNQEQKPVDVTDKSITCRIISGNGKTLLLTKTLVADLPVTGIMSLIVSASDLADIEAQKAYYSLEIPTGDFDFPVFIDQHSGARGEINIVNSVLPSFVPSTELTIPQDQVFPNTHNDGQTYSYYSSVIYTNEEPTTTIQTQLTGYTGNIVIQGSTLVDSDWYNLMDVEHIDATTTVGYTVSGYHPYIRLEFISNIGNVDSILVR